MLSTDIGQSPQLRTVTPSNCIRSWRICAFPPLPNSTPTIRRVADFSNAQRVIWGQYAKFGDQIRIDATLQDFKRERRVTLMADAVSEKDIPGAVDQLASAIRQNLAVSTDVIKELQANSFQPSSKSIPALREYSQGVQFMRDGKNSEALKLFQAAAKDDPEFALAFSKMAEAYSRLGYDNAAEDAALRAVEKSE